MYQLTTQISPTCPLALCSDYADELKSWISELDEHLDIWWYREHVFNVFDDFSSNQGKVMIDRCRLHWKPKSGSSPLICRLHATCYRLRKVETFPWPCPESWWRHGGCVVWYLCLPGAPSSCCDSFWADWVWKMVEIHAELGRNFGMSQDWVIRTIGSLKDLQLWPFTSYKYLENPIYRKLLAPERSAPSHRVLAAGSMSPDRQVSLEESVTSFEMQQEEPMEW